MLLAFQNAGSTWIIGDFYINQDYIVKNVCINRFDTIPICNGKCYLEYKLKANDKQEQKYPTVTYKEVQLFLQHPDQFSFKAVRFVFKKVSCTAEQKSKFRLHFFDLPSSQMGLIFSF